VVPMAQAMTAVARSGFPPPVAACSDYVLARPHFLRPGLWRILVRRIERRRDFPQRARHRGGT